MRRLAPVLRGELRALPSISCGIAALAAGARSVGQSHVSREAKWNTEIADRGDLDRGGGIVRHRDGSRAHGRFAAGGRLLDASTRTLLERFCAPTVAFIERARS